MPGTALGTNTVVVKGGTRSSSVIDLPSTKNGIAVPAGPMSSMAALVAGAAPWPVAEASITKFQPPLTLVAVSSAPQEVAGGGGGGGGGAGAAHASTTTSRSQVPNSRPNLSVAMKV